MTPERWQQIDQLFHSALERDPKARADFLDQACGRDEALRREVESLLAADVESASVTAALPAQVAAEWLAKGQAPQITGRQVGHYKILSQLGAGGMGEVYLAQDTRLGRKAALKLLPARFTQDGERVRRFEREARAASALNHPNILTIYEISDSDELHCIATEFVEGRTLRQRLNAGRMTLQEAFEVETQVASALNAAHTAGIVHRDIKPENIMLRPDGLVKVLDFGLAKLTERQAVVVDRQAPTMETISRTEPGVVMGTVAYMSPEQARGQKVDARSDIFSLGVVLYEMISGESPFVGTTTASVIVAILEREPPPLARYVREVPRELEQIVSRMLAKQPEERYPSIREVERDLKACRAALNVMTAPPDQMRAIWQVVRRPLIALPVVLVLVVALGLGLWLINRNAKLRWAREQALPEISRLIEEEKYTAAFALAQRAEKYIPVDPMLLKLWPDMSRTVSIQTTPPGAAVYMKEYSATTSEWQYMGQSPLDRIKIPRAFFRWKVEKKGFATVEGCPSRGFWPPVTSGTIPFILDEEGDIPPGMVRVLGGASTFSIDLPGFGHLQPVQLTDYWIDKYEVTNKQFKEFVNHGGYQKREYWKQPFVRDGRTISWEEAMAAFCDATGRRGPATWELGEYPHGQDDYPVTGVSWYEAAAYAEFVGKELPTIYHWNKAAGTRISSAIVPLSNFGSQGTARVGSHQGMSAYGTYDMAGNVKEWCWNEAGRGKRYILGGAWNEPVYMFNGADAQSPFARSATFGFRCLKYFSEDAASKTITDLVVPPVRNYDQEKPVSDELFRVFQSLYSYDKTALNPIIETVDDSNENWKKEKIAFNAAYGDERVIAYLFLPKKFAPPYQTIIHFPGVYAVGIPSSNNFDNNAEMSPIDFIIKSGRAVLFPIYKGTYERGEEDRFSSDNPNTTSVWRHHPIFWRDRVIALSKDLGRSIDYLETRPEIDRNKLGYCGLSWGAAMGAILPAIESRLKVSVLVMGGFWYDKELPEVDQINFAPRITIPVLMLSGRYDFVFPVGTSQLPLFRLLGTPQEHKRHVLFETGHTVPRNDMIKETLDWLDRYLGPVN